MLTKPYQESIHTKETRFHQAEPLYQRSLGFIKQNLYTDRLIMQRFISILTRLNQAKLLYQYQLGFIRQNFHINTN